MNWLAYAILAASSFGFYNFFTKISADKFSPALANIFIAGTSLLVAIISTIYLKMSGQSLTFTKGSLILPIMAGLFTGAAEIFYLSMYSKNAPITVGNPLVVGGTIVIAVILGIIILKEPMSAAKIAGIIFVITGLVLLTRS
jgi:bacterial/archaeal transporter family protein